MNYPITRLGKEQYIREEMSFNSSLFSSLGSSFENTLLKGDYTHTTDDNSGLVRKTTSSEIKQTSTGTTPKKRLHVFVMQIFILRAGR